MSRTCGTVFPSRDTDRDNSGSKTAEKSDHRDDRVNHTSAFDAVGDVTSLAHDDLPCDTNDGHVMRSRSDAPHVIQHRSSIHVLSPSESEQTIGMIITSKRRFELKHARELWLKHGAKAQTLGVAAKAETGDSRREEHTTPEKTTPEDADEGRDHRGTSDPRGSLQRKAHEGGTPHLVDGEPTQAKRDEGNFGGSCPGKDFCVDEGDRDNVRDLSGTRKADPGGIGKHHRGPSAEGYPEEHGGTTADPGGLGNDRNPSEETSRRTGSQERRTAEDLPGGHEHTDFERWKNWPEGKNHRNYFKSEETRKLQHFGRRRSVGVSTGGHPHRTEPGETLQPGKLELDEDRLDQQAGELIAAVEELNQPAGELTAPVEELKEQSGLHSKVEWPTKVLLSDSGRYLETPPVVDSFFSKEGVFKVGSDTEETLLGQVKNELHVLAVSFDGRILLPESDIAVTRVMLRHRCSTTDDKLGIYEALQHQRGQPAHTVACLETFDSFRQRADDKMPSRKTFGKFEHQLKCLGVLDKKSLSTTLVWPRYSKSWKESLVQGFVTKLGLDVIPFSLTDPETGRATTQLALATNNKALASCIRHRFKIEDPTSGKPGGDENPNIPPEVGEIILSSLQKESLREKIDLIQKDEAKELNEDLQRCYAATQEEIEAFKNCTPKRRRELLHAAQKVHTNTGHRPVSELARALRQQGAPPEARAAMEAVKCSSCAEHQRPQPSPVAKIGGEARKPWEVVGMDLKECTTKTHKIKYLVIVCEACRLTKAIKIFKIPRNQHRNATTQEVIEAFETGWTEHFGNPRVLRHDPEGSLVSTEFIQEMCQKGIQLAATAGEAHWQLGICERMIQTIFSAAERIASECQVEIERAVSLAVMAQNLVDKVRGFSPAQWAFGRQPNWSGTLHEEPEDEVNISRDTTDSFRKRLELEIEAKRIYEKHQLNEKMLRAQRAKHRKDLVFSPGDVVYAWRVGVNKVQGSKKTKLHQGAWFGPAVVLGTESRTDGDTVIPCAVIWIVINDRLWRCAPQQLRRASEREHAEQTLLQPKPWTFESIQQSLPLGVYRDITQEEYPDEDPEDEMEPQAPEDDPDEEMQEPSSASTGKRQPSDFRPEPGTEQPRRRAWTKKSEGIWRGSPRVDFIAAETAALEARDISETSFFAKHETPDKVIEIAFPILEDERSIRRYLRSPEAFVVTGLRKRRVEITEKRLTPEEKELIRTAKGKEIKEFLKEQVVQRIKEGEHVPEDQIMKMRWVLTWKKDAETGDKKGKARLVVLGFQDPYLGQEHTCAPTLNKRSKQLLLQTVVQKDWRLKKGDVTAAFLQGRKLEKSKYALAPEELAEAMGLKPGERVIRLLKSIYGLTAAPLEWYAQVNTVLHKLGGQRAFSDPCVWIFKDPESGKLVGIIGAHVDDFLIAGDDKSEYWRKCMEALLAAFRWTPWEENKFKQCGVNIDQQHDGHIIQEQEEYLATVEEIPLTAERIAQPTHLVTERERSQLRALLGALQWLVTQTRVDGCIDVNLLQSHVTKATVEDLLAANKILRKLRQGPSKLYIRKIIGPVSLVAWSDASWANRKDGKSTGGFLVGICGTDVLDGKRGHVSIVSWGTNKLKRVARSSMSAEMQALANAEDELHLCRVAWAEFNGEDVEIGDVDKTLKAYPAAIIIDAKSIYDTLTSQTQPLQLAEKRTALELLAYLKNTESNGTQTRWVHGGANLADGLTKQGNHPMLRDFLHTSTWSLPKGDISGKKRAKKGLDKLHDDNSCEETSFTHCAWEKLLQMWPDFVSDSSEDEF